MTRLDSVRCVSFDVFDTLLSRCIEPPDALQHRVATLLAERVGGLSPEQALNARRAAESEGHRGSLTGDQGQENQIDPLVEGWVTHLVGHGDTDLVDFIHRTERELESLALTAKPGVIPLLTWLRSRGLRVIAISDMYSSHTRMVALLDACGLGQLIDRVIVGSEFGPRKDSGCLHAKVLEMEGCSTSEIVHIGGALASDMGACLRLGMRSVFLDERDERRRHRRQTLSEEMAHRGGVWPGRRFFEIVDVRMFHDVPLRAASEDFFHHYGAYVLGPAFSAFLLGLVERIAAVKPNKLFFLARDGYLFQRMYARWRELEPTGERWPEPVYVYASRRVVAAASIADGLTPERAAIAFGNPKQRGLQSVFKTFGLPAERFAGLADEHGFTDLAEPLEDWQDLRLLSFLADDRVQERIRSVGKEARENLRRYFEQLGFFGARRVALVDIGWNGTIQKFLNDSFAGRADYPDVHGWYFAFVAAMHGDFDMGGRIEGLIHDARRGDPYERAPTDFEEIFEQGARSGEGTTLGYARQGGEVLPRLKADDAPDRCAEIDCNPLVERLQAGVLAHLEHFHAAWKLTGYGLAEIKPYVLALLERAVVYPSREEVKGIGRLVHTEDFGHDDTLDMGPVDLTFLDAIAPWRLSGKLRHKPWKFAGFASFRWSFPALAFRLAYFHLLHRRRGG